MKKILLVFDGNHFSEGSFRMANFINEYEPVLATGVFLQSVDYRDIIGYSGIGSGSSVTITPAQTDESTILKNIATFETRCTHAGMEFRTHKDTDLFALEELQRETRFADLMILSAELFYNNIGDEQPNDYLKKVLRQTECPVMLVPEEYELPTKVMLTYDGNPDSVFAIKQFTYLFPQFYQWETRLVTLEEKGEAIPHQELIQELATKHFANLTIEAVNTVTEKTFDTWVADQTDHIIVSGAFGRSELSTLFHKSFIGNVIEDHKVPVFVAHR
jgi:nucleotide-binding universal stress UspA family protein